MTPLKQKIEAWKGRPNAHGSESQAAIIVGEVAAMLGEDVPDAVNGALRTLSLRGTMRDLALAAQPLPRPDAQGFHDIVAAGAASCGISWAESLAVIAKYLGERAAKL